MIGKYKTKFNLKFNKDYWAPILPTIKFRYISPSKKLPNGDYICTIEYYEKD